MLFGVCSQTDLNIYIYQFSQWMYVNGYSLLFDIHVMVTHWYIKYVRYAFHLDLYYFMKTNFPGQTW